MAFPTAFHREQDRSFSSLVIQEYLSYVHSMHRRICLLSALRTSGICLLRPESFRDLIDRTGILVGALNRDRDFHRLFII